MGIPYAERTLFAWGGVDTHRVCCVRAERECGIEDASSNQDDTMQQCCRWCTTDWRYSSNYTSPAAKLEVKRKQGGAEKSLMNFTSIIRTHTIV